LSVAGCSDTERAEVPTASGAVLREVAKELGVIFTQSAGEHADYPLPASMGGGVALFDADSDGDLDLYLVNGNTDQSGPTGASGSEQNALFLQGADGQFRDATSTSGLGDKGYGMGVAVGDIDSDGDLDLYVTNLGADRLFLNQGDGVFTDATLGAGLGDEGWGCSATFLDYDADGDLDLFVTRYVDFNREVECKGRQNGRDFCSPKTFPALSDLLYRNEGGGSFKDVSAAAGISSEEAAGLGVVSADFDGDGWIDIYVANDGYANHLWKNEGDGSFTETAIQRGCALNRDGSAEAGMGVLAEDLDGDGKTDLFMTHLRNESNTLYRNLGAGHFTDATARAGVARPTLPSTGFGTTAFDLELDGDLDIVIVNGRVTRSEVAPGASLPAPWTEYCEPNMLLLSEAGASYSPGMVSGGFERSVSVSRGLARGDIDGDGDMDIVVTGVASPVEIYLNETERSGSWLIADAVMGEAAIIAIGAIITVKAGPQTWSRSVRRGGSYLSSSPPSAHFGLGEATEIDSIEVRWADGVEESFALSEVNQRVTLTRGEGNQLK
jgi:hypothetical protein